MSDDLINARADLAFLRSIAESDPHPSAAFGVLLMTAGLFYGLETLLHWVGTAGLAPVPAWAHLAAAIIATGGFLTVLAVVLWLNHKQTDTGTVTRRAYEAAFQAAGLANISMVCVFAFNAVKAGDFMIWLYYVPVVFAMQGGAWFVAASLRRKAWYGIVALGWFLAAVALGLTIGSGLFNLVTSLSLFLLMALPGFVMWRTAIRAR
jgi:hypothetical protein